MTLKQRILIVEHHETTVDTYAQILRLEGYRVLTALSGEAGLREAESGRPDAIIVDFHMPDIDGLEFLRRLRRNADNRHTPVSLVTGDYFLNDTIRGQFEELGAELRFKPLWLEDLASLIRGLLQSTEPSK
jgi:two-component system OmpR family response regulator